MQRVQRQDQAERVRIALELFPPNLKALLESVDLFFGDPLFCGLHRYSGVAGSSTHTGRPFSFRECLHFCEPRTQHHRNVGSRRPTVVVPIEGFDTWDLCHEFGHALDWMLSRPSESLAVAPITRYAATKPSEAFAEAVAALVATCDSRLFRRGSYLTWLRKNCPGFLSFFDTVSEFNL